MDTGISPTLDRLLARISALERRVLDLEKAAGTAASNQEVPQAAAENPAPSTRRFTLDEKIDLFMALFAHRDDVYALRYEAKDGRKGYTPVCSNKFVSGICDIRHVGCRRCPHRVYKPLDRTAISNHLQGDDPRNGDVIGVYPMATDETTPFLVFDFDGKDSASAALCVLGVCRQLGIQAHLERSRSGDGMHVWLFFSEPVQSTTARKLGSYILTLATQADSTIDFDCYDRMIPNQDHLPKGGFGNLVALPLQGRARNRGNSVFIDEHLQPYKNQWEYLYQIDKNRIPSERVQELASSVRPADELGSLVRAFDADGGSEAVDSPWQRPDTRALSADDFPEVLHIVEADALYIDIRGLSTRAVDQLKRLASFENPQYYQAVAMQRSVYKINRVISRAHLQGSYLDIPRGCRDALIDLLDEAGAAYKIEDKTVTGKAINVTFNGRLKDEQAPAAEAMLGHDTGILWAATGYGKTVVSAYMIASIKRSAVILVNTTTLLNQWRRRLEEFLTIDEPLRQATNKRGRRREYTPVGVLGGGKETLTGNVDVIIYQSLVDAPNMREILDRYGVVIVDECHHASALNFEKVIRSSAAKRIYGVSATPVRGDGHHPLGYMICGPIRYRQTAKQQAKLHSFSHTVIPRITPYLRPETVEPQEWNLIKAQQSLATDALRNETIARDVISCFEKGRSPLVLTNRITQAKALEGLVARQCPNTFLLTGSATNREKRELPEKLAKAAHDGPICIISTGKFAGEGFDLPRLDTLFLAAPVSGRTPLSQYTGRLHREYEGKDEVLVYDYVDFREPILESMYHKRLKGYAELGYQIRHCSSEVQPDKSDDVFTGPEFKARLIADIEGAANELIISSPTLHKSRFFQMLRACTHALEAGTDALILTRPLEEYALDKQADAETLTEALRRCPVRSRTCSGLAHRFAVIDTELVWYGSASLLGYWAKDDCMIRFKDAATAHALINSVRSTAQ